MQINYKQIGQRIKMQRAFKGITQEKLAEETGLSVSHISNAETGKTKIGLKTLILIANALETKPDNLLCDNIKYAKDNLEYYLAKATQDCSEYEIQVLTDIAETLKSSLRKRTTE